MTIHNIIYIIVSLMGIMLIGCNQHNNEINTTFLKEKKHVTIQNPLFLYKIGYKIGEDSSLHVHKIFDTVYRHYPVPELNDTLAILEGSRTLTFMAFKSLRKNIVYLHVNDSASFSFFNILRQVITKKDGSFFRESIDYDQAIIRPKFQKNGFTISFDKDHEKVFYTLTSKIDTIWLDEEGCNEGFDAIMRDNFLRFSNKFYIGITSDKFFENWGLKSMVRGDFTVYLRTMKQYWFDDIWKIVNEKPRPYLHCKTLTSKYKKILNCTDVSDCTYIHNRKYVLLFKHDTLSVIKIYVDFVR